MRLPLLVIGISALVASAPVSDQPREITPNFQGKAPEAFNASDERIGLDPPNCGIGMIHETNIVGDGAVKQWTMWKQISINMQCGAGDCTVTSSNSRSYTVGFSVSGPINRWITGGLNVDTSVETGNSYECSGSAGQTKCIYVALRHNTYTVRDVSYPMDPRCGRLKEGPEVRLTSPVKNAEGRFVWCGTDNTCHHEGWEEWTEGWA